MIATKIGQNSHFALVGGNELYKFENRILQIETTKQYENSKGYAVFLCEIDDEEESNE